MEKIQIHNNSEIMQQNQNKELLELIGRFAESTLDGFRFEIKQYSFPFEERLIIRLQPKHFDNDKHIQYSPEANQS